MSLINLDYADAMLRVKQLENAAAQCDDAESYVRKALQISSSDFEGEFYTAFVDKINEWSAKNKKIGQELRETAALVRKVANEIKAADEAAARAAQ